MTSPYLDFKRDGVDKLLRLAKGLCVLVQSFAHIIRSKYSGNVAIIALLTAVEGVCALLPDAQAEFDAFGSEDASFPSDPSTLNGINPSAGEAPEPDIV
jgi:hypothetical protein